MVEVFCPSSGTFRGIAGFFMKLFDSVVQDRSAWAITVGRRDYGTQTGTAFSDLQFAGTGTNVASLSQAGRLTTAGGGAFGVAALATDATAGHMFIPSSAGAPTGVPASIPTGQVALQYDSVNNKLYAYNGAWKSTATLT